MSSIKDSLTALADAIRSKTGKTGKISIDEMATEVTSIEVGQQTEKVLITSAEYLFAGQIPPEAHLLFKIVKPLAMNHMYFQNDTEKDVDMTKLDFEPNPNAITLNNMFYTCTELESVKLPAGIKATSLMSLVQGCSKLKKLDLNGIDVANCKDYRSMINGTALTEFDGAQIPNLYVVNNNCQNFFYSTKKMRKVWIPKEWQVAPTTAGYSPFVSNYGSNAMNPNLHIFTDAVSESDQISNGKWSKFTMVYNSSGAAIPASQIHYGATHDDYESY